MVDFPNAKINLGLNIISRRNDGFHNLESCFYPIGWTDALEILPSDKLTFTASGISIPGNWEDNLCVKAYKVLQKEYDLPPVHIHLHKNIPIGAGLGGGSSDAAFTVKILNKIFDLGITEEGMESYLRPLGSDCAFFVRNIPVLAFEKGDKFKNIEINLQGKWLLVVYPSVMVSTKEAYAGVIPAVPSVKIEDILRGSVKDWKQNLINDFERSVIPAHKIIQTIKEKLYSAGALYSCMSGSGSAVFGIFEKEIDATKFLPREFLIFQGGM